MATFSETSTLTPTKFAAEIGMDISKLPEKYKLLLSLSSVFRLEQLRQKLNFF